MWIRRRTVRIELEQLNVRLWSTVLADAGQDVAATNQPSGSTESAQAPVDVPTLPPTQGED